MGLSVVRITNLTSDFGSSAEYGVLRYILVAKVVWVIVALVTYICRSIPYSSAINTHNGCQIRDQHSKNPLRQFWAKSVIVTSVVTRIYRNQPELQKQM